ncbi:MAG: HEAT repeat domain-containing protein [Myxococcota bacterium]
MKKIIKLSFFLSEFIIYFFLICRYSFAERLYDATEVEKDELNEILYMINKKSYISRTKEELYKILTDSKEDIVERKAAIYVIGDRGSEEDITRLREIYAELNKDWPFGKKGNLSIHDPTTEILTTIPRAVAKIYIKKLYNSPKSKIDILVLISKGCINKSINDELLCSGIYSLIERDYHSEEEIKALLTYKDDEQTKPDIILAINYNPYKIALPTMLEYLNENIRWYDHFFVIRAIQKIGDKGAIPHLKKILDNKDEYPKVKKAAEEAIERLSK